MVDCKDTLGWAKKLSVTVSRRMSGGLPNNAITVVTIVQHYRFLQLHIGFIYHLLLQIYTAVGNRAAITLTKEKLQTLNSGAVDYFFKRDELVPGIKYLIASYKQVLLGFSPAHVLLLINACLIIFVLLCLFLVFNLGRELNVLNDESIPTKALKWILYAISFLWIIKWWLWLLGWVGEKPKTRMAYLFLPAGICLICVLVAWVSSPNNFQLIQDTISKQ